MDISNDDKRLADLFDPNQGRMGDLMHNYISQARKEMQLAEF